MYILLLLQKKIIDRVELQNTLLLTGGLYSRIGHNNSEENTGTFDETNKERIWTILGNIL
jgi:hypothetical protein